MQELHHMQPKDIYDYTSPIMETDERSPAGSSR
jgi:hypothetical protein